MTMKEAQSKKLFWLDDLQWSMAYEPATTVYNRYHRWAKRGLWEAMFRELTSIVGTHYENSIASTIVKAHRSASGKKGVVRKRLAGAEAGGPRKSTR